MNCSYCISVSFWAAIMGLAPVALAQAAGSAAGGPPQAAGDLAGGRRGSPHHVPDSRAAGAGVRLSGGDIPALGQNDADDQGRERRVGTHGRAGRPGAYRYNFNVDGVTVVDPRSPVTSESNANVWSMVYVPGSDFDGHARRAARRRRRRSRTTRRRSKRDRRMHVYTPPGYEAGSDRYPVFYLLHGAGDCDDSWTTGRPRRLHPRQPHRREEGEADDRRHAGGPHQSPARPRRRAAPARTRPTSSSSDFLTDVVPYVEKNYRVITDAPTRAIAGLSMGGNQTLYVAVPHLDKFAYIGVFSSGLLGGDAAPRPRPRGAAPAAPPPPFGAAFEERYGTRCSTTPRSTQGPEGLLVRDRQGRRPDHDDASRRSSCSRSTASRRSSRKPRRPHVAQLARLPHRVRADAVSVEPRIGPTRHGRQKTLMGPDA